jgi:multidrug resistance efflux pump
MKNFALVFLSILITIILVIVVIAARDPLMNVGREIRGEEMLMPVTITPVEHPVRSDGSVQAACRLLPQLQANLSFNASGLLQEIRVNEGQTVEAGAVLALLDGQNQAQADLASAERQLNEANTAIQKLNDEIYLSLAQALKTLRDARMVEKEAKKQLERLQEDKKGADEIAQAEAVLGLARARLQQAQLTYDSYKNGPDPAALAAAEWQQREAEAKLQAAQEALDQRSLRAPFKGTVVELFLSEGEFAGPSVPLLVLADLSDFYVETTNLTELNIPFIQVGAPVEVTFDALPEQTFTGTVNSIQPYGKNNLGDIVYRTQIRGDFNNPALLWGMTCSATINP